MNADAWSEQARRIRAADEELLRAAALNDEAHELEVRACVYRLRLRLEDSARGMERAARQLRAEAAATAAAPRATTP